MARRICGVHIAALLIVIGCGGSVAFADSTVAPIYTHTATDAGDLTSPEFALRSLAFDPTASLLYAGYIHGQQTRWVEKLSLNRAVTPYEVTNVRVDSRGMGYNFGAFSPIPPGGAPPNALMVPGDDLRLAPMALALVDGGKYLVVAASHDTDPDLSSTTPSGLYLLKTADMSLVSLTPIDQAANLTTGIEGLAVTADGKHLYATFGDTIRQYAISQMPNLPPDITPTGWTYTVTGAGRLRGLEVVGDDLYAADKGGNTLYCISTSNSTQMALAMNSPMDVTHYTGADDIDRILVSHFAGTGSSVYLINDTFTGFSSASDPLGTEAWFGPGGGYTGIEADPLFPGNFFIAAANQNPLTPGDGEGRDLIYYFDPPVGHSPELNPACLALLSACVGAVRLRRRAPKPRRSADA